MNIKISMADDHPMMIQGMQNILLRHTHIQLIGTYLNGTALLSGLETALPDVLLLDIQLPGQTGDELAPIILKKYPTIKILAVTNFDSALYADNMLTHGVQGYILKTADEQVLISAIETVYNGKEFIDESIQEKLKEAALNVKKRVSLKSTLTRREKEVLQLIVDGRTSQEIGDTLFICNRTVENYRVSILLKLEVSNTAALVKKALMMGIVT